MVAKVEVFPMDEVHYERQSDIPYEEFLRKRITELRLKRNVSERQMSFELGRSNSYIRHITCENALPSMKEFFNIIDYLNVTVDEFFAPLKDIASPYNKTCERIRACSDEDLTKVNTFLDMIGK